MLGKSGWERPAVRAVADKHGIKVHMDGARIFNASTASGVPVKDYAALADSVMFCLSKGLSAPVGSMLAGPRNFIDFARRIRKALGGGMRQVGVLAAPGIIALTEMRSLEGEALKVAPGSGHRVQIPLQGELAKGMVARFI